MIYPHNINILLWAASLVNDFPNTDIPLLTKESEWQLWGKKLSETSPFPESGCPSPILYKDWNKWAKDVYLAMYNFSNS